ncbi:phage minor capsid protein [Neobacillus mesonae]|uniref:phage minor capsid protein n=1 Tax=Neobacillus mesonae TaxID=1193713 RepID=UPI0025745594|nr:phage minor capsid protein [Neobacillus mesonae]
MKIDDLDKSADALIKKYKEVYAYILERLQYQIDNGLSETHSILLLNEIQSELKRLDYEAYKWSQEVLPEFYYISLKAVDKELAVSSYGAIASSAAQIHKKALEVAINDLYRDLAKNTTFMLNQSKKIIRDNAKELIDQMIISGESYETIKRELKKRLLENGVTSFIDAAGRHWTIDKYVEMAIKTKSRILHNEGTVNRMLEYQEKYPEAKKNFDLIQISSHMSKCWCGKYENTVWSISGDSDTYPSIKLLPNQPYKHFHPRCKHVWLSYNESLRGEGEVISPFYLGKSVKELAKMQYHVLKRR